MSQAGRQRARAREIAELNAAIERLSNTTPGSNPGAEHPEPTDTGDGPDAENPESTDAGNVAHDAEHKDDQAAESSDEDHEDQNQDSTQAVVPRDESALLAKLAALRPFIVAKHAITAEDLGVVPGLRKTRPRPWAHQKRAAAVIKAAQNNMVKGLILADSAGMGKTLSALMAVAATSHDGLGPSIIVTSSSGCQRWLDDIKRFFDKDSLPTLCLTEQGVDPFAIYDYKVVITSYRYLASEAKLTQEGYLALDKYYSAPTGIPPACPPTTLLSELLKGPDVRGFGKYLILDEPHCLYRPHGHEHTAIAYLRKKTEVCVLVSANPFSGTWADMYSAMKILNENAFPVIEDLRVAFTRQGAMTGTPDRTEVPTGRYLTRLVEFASAVLLRRTPEMADMGYHEIGPLDIRTVNVTLSEKETKMTNNAFRRGIRVLTNNSNDGAQENEESTRS